MRAVSEWGSAVHCLSLTTVTAVETSFGFIVNKIADGDTAETVDKHVHLLNLVLGDGGVDDVQQPKS